LRRPVTLGTGAEASREQAAQPRLGVTMGAVFPAGCQVMIRLRANQATWAATGLAWAPASGSVSQGVYGNQSSV